ncbi:hypothetical protein FACS1894124_3350 [Spirochaetia bacterium]|nr:hypothetical protein FACS1894124_3350 [Spirochaetia bacterium]
MPGITALGIRTVLFPGPPSGLSQKIKALPVFLLLYNFLTLGLSSCQARDLPHDPFREAFYAGLLAEAGGGEAGNTAAGFYETALKSPSAVIQEAAAGKLLPLLLERQDTALAERLLAGNGKYRRTAEARTGGPMYLGALYTAGRYGEVLAAERDSAVASAAGRLIGLLAALEDEGEGGAQYSGTGRELAAFFLTSPPEGLYTWGLGRIRDREAHRFSAAEIAAIEGRRAAARSSFGEALRAFRAAVEQEPALFVRFPELLTDLGRSFQFAAAGNEGQTLFREWEEQLRSGVLEGAGDTRYRLLYFTGRIERQRGNHEAAAAAFAQALDFAPDKLQADACIWYLLNTSFQSSPDTMVPLLKTYIPRMSSVPYFDDILERLARHLTAKRQWRTLLEAYKLLPPRAGGSARAQYAYILGRAAEAGYIPERAEAFFKAACGEERASFYYRSLAAYRLGSEAVTIPGTAADNPPAQRKGTDFPHPAEMEFLLGFFQYGAGRLVWPYIQERQDGLSIPELRTLAEALQADGQWDTSLRLIAAYMEREDYRENRADLERYFPRPYRDLVERYGEQADIPPYLLYGLIRAESAFMADISSRVGAAGLTQLMPDTAVEMAGRVKRQGGPDYRAEGDIDLRDPEVNIHLGAVYLRYLMDRLENPMLALLAYNGGYTRVRRWKTAASDLPVDLLTETIEYNETRDYGRKVMAAAAVYGYLYYSMTMEAILADIFR